MHLANYLSLIPKAERDLADASRQVAEGHKDEPDVYHLCHTLARQCDGHDERLKPFVDRYGEEAQNEPDRLHKELFKGTREGGLGLLSDLHDFYLMASECDISWTMIGQVAQGVRDKELLGVLNACDGETSAQLK